MPELGPLKNLIQNDTCQVFLMICPASLPFSFATHPWFVVSRKGVITWYGISWRKTATDRKPLYGHHTCNGCVGHLHKDASSPDGGISVLLFSERWFWKGRVAGVVTGSEESLAARMADFIEHSLTSYPYGDHYSLTGPNSNTYPQWVLHHFPESGLKLPWNAVGKGYATRRFKRNV